MIGYTFLCFTFVIIYNIYTINGQVPPRLLIPGAVLVSRPPQQRTPSDASQLPPARLRKPIPNAIPIAIPIREDVEDSGEPEDNYPKPFISPLAPQIARIQSGNEEEPAPKPIVFRPERPLPILRQDTPLPPQRAVSRLNIGDETLPTRQPNPQVRRIPAQQPPRQPPKPQPRPVPSEYSGDQDGRRNKNRKPPVQILRKYRTDNEDGSITWGFENEDGTFKEETIGTDCVIRGKYGYIDPEGTKREYNYEAGNKCDLPEEEPDEVPAQPNVPGSRPSAYPKRPTLKAP